jgi:hypothetical protein
MIIHHHPQVISEVPKMFWQASSGPKKAVFFSEYDPKADPVCELRLMTGI